MNKTFFNWSTGKDSALAFYKALSNSNFKIEALVTSVNLNLKRVSMHGVPLELLQSQADNLGLPLKKILISGEVSMDEYSEIMRKEMTLLKNEGFEYSVFGDIFLEDLKKYRIEKLNEVGLKGVFPLWKIDTKQIIQEFLELGFKAITVSVNANLLDESFVGVDLNEDFFNRLPENVDVCGENGEFHTFVYDGPIFSKPIDFEVGKKVLKTYKTDEKTTWDSKFWYCDLIPISN